MNEKNYYQYVFSNNETHMMTPVEAHRYAFKKVIDIVSGPGYKSGRQEKSFDGWGWHDSLKMNFRGPSHYREYLKQNGLIEVGNERSPLYKEYEPPVWNEELIRKAINVHGINIGSVLAEALLSGEVAWPDEG